MLQFNIDTSFQCTMAVQILMGNSSMTSDQAGDCLWRCLVSPGFGMVVERVREDSRCRPSVIRCLQLRQAGWDLVLVCSDTASGKCLGCAAKDARYWRVALGLGEMGGPDRGFSVITAFGIGKRVTVSWPW